MIIALAHKVFDLKGGTERVLYRTAEGLKNRGHEVHLFCGRFRIPPPQGVFEHRVPCLSWPRTARLLSFALTVPKMIARYPCDVVVSFDRMTKQDIFRSGGGPHKAFLRKIARQSGFWRKLWYQVSIYHRCVLAIEKRQLGPGGCKKVITVSKQGKREMIEDYGVPEDRVTVIHNGVDHERFNPRRRLVEGVKVREKLGIPLNVPVVLFVGTGFRRKGLDRLLSLWGSPEMDGIHFIVVGDDARLPYYRNRWSRKEIIFAGPQDAVEGYYAAADLFVLPSTQEAFGNAVLEALASGLPVVTVPEIGATEKIEGDLREGMLFNRDDPEELKAKVLHLLDKKRWPALSSAARLVAERYSWDNYLVELERQLHEVIGLH